ncbi:MAG: carboxypeptidase-like regulatory domain-containing protein, partial [Acidobacteriota bacterium]|nr:carboxypeptidase-like regulatory domain-containing protein [Acidobacteriota bacterium]
MLRFIVTTVLILFANAMLRAQFDSGQIAGYVRDASQAIVTGANVTVVSQGNGDQHQSTTNSNGYYIFPNLPVGTYSVSAELAGFKKSVKTGIVLDSASKQNIDLSLTVGAVSDSVEVQASATQLQTESAQVGRVVDSKQIQDMT